MVELPNTPIDFDWDRKSATYGGVRNFTLAPDYPRVGYTLLLGPAERADIIIDFSQFAGKKLILYNDAPAPFPYFDPRYDLYTNNPDQTALGGPTSTKPGLGPNTRTLMQIKVGTRNPVPFDPAPLKGTLPTIFASSQPPPLVPPGTYGGNDLYVLKVPGFPTPDKTFAGFPVMQKSITEEWEPQYGRMTARLGTNKLRISNQGIDTFAFDFVEPPTEMMSGNASQDQTQIWFVSHGGIDTHPIHFHLLNVQVINRVDAAGVIKPPDPNEMGWKETLRMNAFENVVIAVKPINKPTVPFLVPTGVRPLDVTKPPTGIVGSVYDRQTNPNPLQSFDWQYVWHCHILGHEENDMMRPLILMTEPFAPRKLVAQPLSTPARVDLTWMDSSKNETRFALERATDAQFAKNLVKFMVEQNPGNLNNAGGARTRVTHTDDTVKAGVTYHYRVRAANAAGSSPWAKAAPVTPQ